MELGNHGGGDFVFLRNVGTQIVYVGSDTDTGDFIFRGTGNVGIGTSSPYHELTVVGDISATGTIHGSSGVSKYVADWATSHGGVTVANEAQLTITHNLGTRDFTTSMWVNVSAGELNAQEIVGFEGQDSVYEVGANVVNIIDENSCHVQLGKHGYGDVGHASGNHAGHGVGDFGPVTFASKYMKIVIIG